MKDWQLLTNRWFRKARKIEALDLLLDRRCKTCNFRSENYVCKLHNRAVGDYKKPNEMCRKWQEYDGHLRPNISWT